MGMHERLINASARPNALPGAIIFVAMRMFLWRMLLAVVILAIASAGSRSTCGPTFDAHATGCVSLSLSPSPLAPIIAFLLSVWVMGYIVRRYETEKQSIEFLSRVSRWALVIAIVGAIGAQIYFWFIPIEGFPQEGTWISPFPFSNLNVTHY